MGTEVLHPQDCLNQRIGFTPTVFHRRKSFFGNGNPRPNHHHHHHHRKPILKPDQRKRSPEPSISKRSASSEDLRPKSNNKHSQNNLLVGQITILKRGESLGKIKSEPVPANNNCDELIISGTERLGPGPEMVSKQIKLSSVPSGGSFRPDMYAGSAFSLSPSPSSLPLPSFFSKKKVSEITDASATRDLRRLLRLD